VFLWLFSLAQLGSCELAIIGFSWIASSLWLCLLWREPWCWTQRQYCSSQYCNCEINVLCTTSISVQQLHFRSFYKALNNCHFWHVWVDLTMLVVDILNNLRTCNSIQVYPGSQRNKLVRELTRLWYIESYDSTI
jgi:hypothetical protein